MGLFGRAKRESSDDIKPVESIPIITDDKTSHEEITDLKKEIQNAALMLESYTHELEKTKTELDVITSEAKTVHEEVESARVEIQSIRAERDLIQSQIKNAKEELELVKSQYSKSEVDNIRRQVNEVREEL